MKNKTLDGTLVLEKLSEQGLLDQFYEAIDSDQIEVVKKLLKSARIDSETIKSILRQIIDGSN